VTVADDGATITRGPLTLEVDHEAACVSALTLRGRPVVTGPIEATLWRAPTDNDGVAQGWMSEISGVRNHWLAWGLDRLRVEPLGTSITATDDGVRLVLRRNLHGSTPAAHHATHRSVVTVLADGRVRFEETITVPSAWTDLPRVGLTMPVDARFEGLRWFGLGPEETYPDRKAAAIVGRWRSSIADQYHPYVVPQEHGHHTDARWFELRDGRDRLRFRADGRFGFSVRGHTDVALTTATTLAELDPADHVEVHIDAAMRGLGTAACGPDVLADYRVGPGIHRLTWTIEPG
jgi:beta-galactosidase